MLRILPVVVLATVLPILADDVADFITTPPVEAWLLFNPVGFSGFNFSGGQCRLTCALPTLEAIHAYQIGAYPRAGVFAPTEFSDAVVSVDLTDWVPTTNRESDGQFHGVLTRVQPGITLFNVSAYGLSMIDIGNGSARLQLDIITNEFTITPLATPVDFPLDPTRDYRLVLSSRGDIHTGRIFDLANPATPVAQITGQDDHFTTGRCGFSVSTDRYTAVDATFDNFLAWDGSPPPLTIQPGAAPGTIELTCDLRRSMASDLQTTTDLTQAADFWQPAVPQSSAQAGGQLVNTFSINGASCFFRRKSL
jgi:hypothetical protein